MSIRAHVIPPPNHLLTVVWTMLVREDNISIVLPTADDPSPNTLSVSLLASPTEGESNDKGTGKCTTVEIKGK